MAQYAIQKVPKIVGRDIVTKEPKVTLKFLKDLTFTNGSETVALTQDGVPLVHFEHSKSFGLSGTNTTIDDYLMSLQLGTDVEVLTSTTEIKILETLTVTTADTAELSYTATGVAGAELLWAEILAADGTPASKLQQAAVVAADKFTVTGKDLAFNTREAPVGTKIQVSYYPTAASARKIKNVASNYVVSLDWDVHCRFLEACSKQEKLGYIHLPSGYMSGSFEWNTAEAADPATHAFELMAESNCSDGELYSIFWYSEDDLS